MRGFVTVLICVFAFILFAEGYLAWRGFGCHENYTQKNDVKPLREPISPERRHRILCIGCSFTYGQGVLRDDAFAHKLEKYLPDTSVDNAGIIGAGYVAMLPQESYYLQQRKYDLVIFSTIANHIWRDVESVFELDFPCADVAEKCVEDRYLFSNTFPIWVGNSMRKITFSQKETYLPGAPYSRLLTFLSNAFRDRYYASRHNPLASYEYKCRRAQYAARTMYSIAKQHDVPFGIVGLYGYAPHAAYLDTQSVEQPLTYFTEAKLGDEEKPFAIPSFDATHPKDYMRHDELHNRCQPDDMNGDHPSPLLHDYYAQKIADWVRREFNIY